MKYAFKEHRKQVRATRHLKNHNVGFLFYYIKPFLYVYITVGDMHMIKTPGALAAHVYYICWLFVCVVLLSVVNHYIDRKSISYQHMI